TLSWGPTPTTCAFAAHAARHCLLRLLTWSGIRSTVWFPRRRHPRPRARLRLRARSGSRLSRLCLRASRRSALVATTVRSVNGSPQQRHRMRGYRLAAAELADPLVGLPFDADAVIGQAERLTDIRAHGLDPRRERGPFRDDHDVDVGDS